MSSTFSSEWLMFLGTAIALQKLAAIHEKSWVDVVDAGSELLV